jgi:uncharacterized protein (TIGR01370 family)
MVLGLLGSCGKIDPIQWIVYYGDSLKDYDLSVIDLAIVEPDNMDLTLFRPYKTRFIAYVSVGEISQDRDFWPRFKRSSFLVEPNPDWPDAMRIDIRHSEWQEFLMTHLIPEYLTRGYAGVFLDTIDTAEYLEETFPQRFFGCRGAQIAFIQELRRRFPKMAIYPNNGLTILPYIGHVIDGVVVEDLYTSYDFSKQTSVKPSRHAVRSKEKVLDAFKRKHKKPVFNILYEESTRSNLAKFAIRRSNYKGYHWYLTTVDLLRMGTIGR